MMRLVLIGDADSPHLLKWARALAPRVELYVCSSRGFAPGFDALVPPERRLALQTRPNFEGGNVRLLAELPRLVRWLRRVQPDWLAPHYLSSHGTLAWLAVRWGGVRARIAGSAWGSDILVAPERSRVMRWLTRRVLAACTLCTADSQHMGQRMRELGARDVMCFPFGLEQLPPPPGAKDEALFFANRGLEPIYQPLRVLEVFAAVAAQWPQARLVMAHDGSLREAVLARIAQPDLAGRVQWVGRLSAPAMAEWYRRARWFISLPQSDSVSVSVLEAMAHGCVPLLSDLPANRELVQDGDNGLILRDGAVLERSDLAPLAERAGDIALALHQWVASHAVFDNDVQRYLDRLRTLCAPELALT